MNAPEEVNTKVMGLATGTVFALPVLAIAFLAGLLMVLDSSTVHDAGLWAILTALASMGTALAWCGRWWGSRGTRLGIVGVVLVAMLQGAAWILVFQVVFYSIASLQQNPPRPSQVQPFAEFIAIVVASVYALVMGVVIRWRVHRALNRN